MRSDDTFLLDMLIVARKIKTYTAALTEDAFYQSELHQSAIIRELQVISEAARLVSDATKQAHPAIQWTQIAGMRNRLIHEYFRISLEIVWQVVQDDIQPLIVQLEAILPSETSSQ